MQPSPMHPSPVRTLAIPRDWTSDKPLVFLRAQVSWKGVQVQGMCARTK